MSRPLYSVCPHLSRIMTSSLILIAQASQSDIALISTLSLSSSVDLTWLSWSAHRAERGQERVQPDGRLTATATLVSGLLV